MAIYQAPNVTTYGYTPPGTGHGEAGITQHLHSVAYVSAALAANDVIQFGYLPVNAVVVGAVLKADGQLDGNGAPTLAFDLGVTGSPALFKSAITTVGRVAGASADSTNAAAGTLYQNTSGGKLLVYATATAAAATGAAGNVEVDISYFLADTPGSAA